MMEAEFQQIFENITKLNQSQNSMDLESYSKPLNCPDPFQYNPPPIGNMTESEQQAFDQTQTLIQVHYYLYFILIPIVCVFGFFGNILNVIVFSKKKTCRALDEIEYCTTICLVALAVSDMMFCLCTFPQTLNKRYNELYKPSEFMLYYMMYASFAINSFIMSSTLLTVMTAIMRYTAICHPFHSRQIISYRKTVFVIIIVFVFSISFNIPHIWRYAITDINCSGPQKYVILSIGSLYKNESFVYTHKLLWAIVGNFIPLILLLYCNIRLVRALHASQKLRLLHSRDNVGCLSAHRRINIVLITIIILFFVLVAPSEISTFISLITNVDKSAKKKYTYALVSMVTNTLQCINFSINFILYYILLSPFRKTLNHFICVSMIRRRTQDSSNSHTQQTCVLITMKDQRRASK